MADVGHIAIKGFKAGAIKYKVLRGFTPKPGSGHTIEDVYQLLLLMQIQLNKCLTLPEFMALK